jgi:hypothetical protein
VQSIEIDFDVFKALTALRASEQDAYNDVLRSLLKLPSNKLVQSAEQMSRASPAEKAWQTNGFNFPAGTEFRARYKGKMYTGTIDKGALLVNGKHAVNPSSAANMITGNNVNGWRFWEARLPGQPWRRMDFYRTRSA